MSGPVRCVETISLDMSSTAVSHTTPTQLKVALGSEAAYIEVINPSTTPIQLGVGGAGGESLIPCLHPQNTGSRGIVPTILSAGQRLTAKAIGAADISAGTLIINTYK